ncbi:hypothetical protein L0337_11100 [candidate division KSB1 bacterium]|nr:hypothetical protein [candidate division KSB1 bacterium]
MTKNSKHRAVGWCLLFWLRLAAVLFAQPRDLRFEHISVEQGLSNFTVNAIATL